MLFAVLFVASLLATVIIVPVAVIRLPSDYFKLTGERPKPFREYSPPVRMTLLIGKNILGLALVIMGIAMLVLPGQGIIVILIGVSLLDFPGKRQLERWLISRGPILKFANWMRCKFDKEPLTLH